MDSVQIVDFYHAMEHAGLVLAALLGREHPDYKTRLRRWAKQLLKDQVEKLIKQARQECAGKVQAAAVEKELGYFVNNKSRMQYGTFRRQGFFIGSGVVEAGCKTVIGSRCKQSGMFWGEAGAENVLALRCIHASRRLDQFWKERLNVHAARNDRLAHSQHSRRILSCAHLQTCGKARQVRLTPVHGGRKSPEMNPAQKQFSLNRVASRSKEYVITGVIAGLLAMGMLIRATADQLELTIGPGEYWWGGLSARGYETPYDATSKVAYDLWGSNLGNQAQPLLLSSKGRYVWSEEPIKYAFDKGTITVTTRQGKIESGTAGKTLRDAYGYAVKKFFPPDGKIPDALLFTHPQYNTWIELMYDQNEEDILKYAKAIIAKGYPPGVLMIDDNWQENYGVWEFSPRRFKNPRGMIKQLHDMGFKVMLWMCPFVSADSTVFRQLAQDGLLLLDPQKTQNILWANTQNKAAIIRWWNGASACLDLSNPKAQAWFKKTLDHLVNEYGVDGFKFDAGDANFYTGGVVSWRNGITPNDHTRYFAEFGLNYPLNEYRASWKMAGLPLAQRLRDKGHEWGDLAKLIPDQMSQSVMGYAYTCPDMIGGGEYRSFLKATSIDEELVVRSAQVHALMPMMQFSVAPWRILSPKNEQICLDMARLHVAMGDHILALAREASKTGEPIVKPMALAFPDGGYEKVNDQFVLGNDMIVAPVVKKGARSRSVVLPEGNWKAEDGKSYQGGQTVTIDVPLERLPYFKLVAQ